MVLTSSAYLHHLSPLPKPSIRPNQQLSHEHHFSQETKLRCHGSGLGRDSAHQGWHIVSFGEYKTRHFADLVDSNNLQMGIREGKRKTEQKRGKRRKKEKLNIDSHAFH